MSVKDLKLIAPELTRLKTAIQVGSQSGDEAEYLAGLGFEVLCIDPEPLHKSHDKITVLEAAVSDQSSVQVMYRAGGMNSLDRDYVQNWRGYPVKLERITAVPVIKLSDLPKADLLIIDAEGIDYKVLNGLDYKPAAVIFEVTRAYQARCNSCLDTLKSLGYHKFLAILHCGDDIVEVKKFEDSAWMTGEKSTDDWFANIVAKLDPGPWRLND